MRDVYMHVHVHVLCCFALFVCLTLLASFFLPSHLSFKNMYMYNPTRGSFGKELVIPFPMALL